MHRVAPPQWPIPAIVAERTRIVALTRAHELAELRRLYPQAAPWCANDGSWYAAPGDDTLLRAFSARELAEQIAEHYRCRAQAAAHRPVGPGGMPRQGRNGATARGGRGPGRAAASTRPARSRRGRHAAPRRGLIRRWLGL